MINLLTGVNSTASALNAERIRMEVVSQNIANANVSNYQDGQPYQRQVVRFETMLNAQAGQSLTGLAPETTQVARVEKDARPPRLIYDPDNPFSDANGCVAVPNVNIHEEMVDLITASRAFEANLAVVKSARNLALQTLAIGKRS